MRRAVSSDAVQLSLAWNADPCRSGCLRRKEQDCMHKAIVYIPVANEKCSKDDGMYTETRRNDGQTRVVWYVGEEEGWRSFGWRRAAGQG